MGRKDGKQHPHTGNSVCMVVMTVTFIHTEIEKRKGKIYDEKAKKK